MHEHRQTLPFGQVLHTLADRFQALLPYQPLLHIRRSVGHIHRSAGLFVWLVQAGHVLRALMARVTRVIHRQVGRDAIQPSRELRARLVARP